MTDTASGAFNQTHIRIGEMQVISAADELFNHVDSDRPMWSETGDRNVRVTFFFETPFHHPPALSLGVIGIDCDHSNNLRYNLAAENVTKAGFEAVLVTWDDTRIARASISWQAIGQMPVRARPARPVRPEPAE